MLQFLPYCNDISSSGKADTEQLSKRMYHKYSVLIAFTFYHPHNRIQGIIKKMRIDLRLKGIQLTFSLFFLLFYNVICQFPQLFHHRPNGISQMLNFRRTSNINFRFLIYTNRFQRIFQLFQRLDNSHSHKLIGKYHQAYSQDNHDHSHNFCSVKILEQSVCRSYTDNFPPGIAHCFYHNCPVFALKSFFIYTVLVVTGYHIIFFQHIGKNKVLFGMINNLTITVNKINIPHILAVDLCKKLTYSAEIHVNQQNPTGYFSFCGKLNSPA